MTDVFRDSQLVERPARLLELLPFDASSSDQPADQNQDAEQDADDGDVADGEEQDERDERQPATEPELVEHPASQ
jgi:hypothetical protein